MAKKGLPGWLYMLVGIALILYSLFIESKTGANLTIFLWVGGAFIIFGFGREIKRRVFGHKKKRKEIVHPPHKEDHTHDHKHPAGHHYHGKSHHETHVHTQPHKHPSHPHKVPHKRCPRCHTLNALQRNVCRKCAWDFS